MNWKRWIWRTLIVLAALAIGYWLGHRDGSGGADESSGEGSGPVAHVTLAPIERKSIALTITAYGNVIAQPGKTHAVSAAYETRVRHVLVAPGQRVTKGQPLVAIDASAQTQLQVAQARSAAAAAQKGIEQAQQRFNLKLATNQELAQAKKDAETAQLQLQSLEKQGASGEQEIKAEMDGLVGKVDVQDGQVVPAGNPLVELVARGEIEVKLGVEPEEVAHVKPGQPVALYRVHLAAAEPIIGRVRLITERVDPDTRLVDVYVSLPNDGGFLLDSFFRAEIQAQAHDALVVPRAAVLPQEDRHVLFTIKDHRAVRHEVQIGIQTAEETEVIARDLRVGEPAVARGNYELSDGMAVATGAKP